MLPGTSLHEESLPANINLQLVINDPNVIRYLSQFDEETARAKAAEALKVGVIAIMSASPSLDMEVVNEKFTDIESRLSDKIKNFDEQMGQLLADYMDKTDGELPNFINSKLADLFDIQKGSVPQLLTKIMGPESVLIKRLDPQNKDGILNQLTETIEKVVENRITNLTAHFSLEDEGSTMAIIKKSLEGQFMQLANAIGIDSGAKEEAKRGARKGVILELQVYEDYFSTLCNQLGDSSDLVRGKVGIIKNCKTGDYLVALGDTSGAPGEKIVFEIKDQDFRLKDAIEELRQAKENREAKVGVFIFIEGRQPPEIKGFKRIGEDYYITISKEDFENGKPLPFLDAAYKIARSMLVASARVEAGSVIDFQKIKDAIARITKSAECIDDILTKAKTIITSGEKIRDAGDNFKREIDVSCQIINQILEGS
ncbi:MAG: hypothetical protein ACKO16_07200 [Gemmataceae bacterium]